MKEEIGQRTDGGSPAFFNFGKILFGAARECGEFRVGLFDGYAGFESSEQKQRTIFAGVRGLIGCGHFEGRPQLRGKSGQMEARRHDADDGVIFAIEADGAADQRSVRYELPLPEFVAEDHDAVAARLNFLVIEGSAELGRNAEHAEIIWRNSGRADCLRLASGLAHGSEVHRAILIRCGGVCEDLVRFAPCEEIGNGNGIGVRKKTVPRIDGGDYCDALGIATRRTPQHKGADQTEHRGVHSDAESEGEDGYGGEAGVLAELTETIAQIREHRAKPIAELDFADLLFDFVRRRLIRWMRRDALRLAACRRECFRR